MFSPSSSRSVSRRGDGILCSQQDSASKGASTAAPASRPPMKTNGGYRRPVAAIGSGWGVWRTTPCPRCSLAGRVATSGWWRKIVDRRHQTRNQPDLCRLVVSSPVGGISLQPGRQLCVEGRIVKPHLMLPLDPDPGSVPTGVLARRRFVVHGRSAVMQSCSNASNNIKMKAL